MQIGYFHSQDHQAIPALIAAIQKCRSVSLCDFLKENPDIAVI